MKLKILGTCAAEGWPALFCDARMPESRKLGGKNIRTRSSLQINDDLKIDFPPDTMSHVHKYGLELHNLKYLLVSHSHSDHLAVHDLEYMMEPFALPPVFESLKIFGNGASIKRIKNAQTEKVSRHPGLLNEIHSFQELDLLPYKISTLKAMHKPDEESLNYIIEKDGKRVLYACDTGYYESSTMGISYR
jgi:phosphoribosyl 1,2-cyclic phosphate phosphodiesterase